MYKKLKKYQRILFLITLVVSIILIFFIKREEYGTLGYLLAIVAVIILPLLLVLILYALVFAFKQNRHHRWLQIFGAIHVIIGIIYNLVLIIEGRWW
ncbi:hypothetical protein [Entomospira culicis]|uniref:Uncharacterized protein n=1 Tax=Entomospira culicis TaxID=2719989 RepID=A0A968KZT9_9SPIO|nr:hypothetical protein [Entomospira culicis]NIZ19429.1 hypothetical protein [Entomospira culicis]NIZ69666.1 hypothetical protein [Entomospira culicis]WDI36776.1 hypothetical protein PVA46_05480 [Entomospira culicis]WDI38405.1 hypothetical protein PVA47_05490 [Entomospira culicis]